jgi:hypothetical protein
MRRVAAAPGLPAPPVVGAPGGPAPAYTTGLSGALQFAPMVGNYSAMVLYAVALALPWATASFRPRVSQLHRNYEFRSFDLCEEVTGDATAGPAAGRLVRASVCPLFLCDTSTLRGDRRRRGIVLPHLGKGGGVMIRRSSMARAFSLI